MSAEPAPALRLVHCSECEKLRGQLDSMAVDLENAQEELKRSRRRMKVMERDANDRTKRSPNYEIAERLFDYWRKECGHPNAKFGPRRAKVLLARLDDYTPREIAQAIKGAAIGAYVDPRGVRHDDIELICRDEVKLENFIQRYESAKGATA